MGIKCDNMKYRFTRDMPLFKTVVFQVTEESLGSSQSLNDLQYIKQMSD